MSNFVKKMLISGLTFLKDMEQKHLLDPNLQSLT